MNRDPYKRLAKIYDLFVEPATTVLRKITLKMFPPKENTKVLEVGCGTGANLKLYQQAGCIVSGIDISPSMLEQAKRKLGYKIDLRLGDASEMPFSDRSFDIVIAMLTLHEMPGQIRQPVLNEMARVVKKDGRILLIDFHPGPLQFPKGWLYKIFIMFFEIGAGREHFRNYRDFHAKKGIAALIDTNCLTIEQEKIISGGNLVFYLIKLREK